MAPRALKRNRDLLIITVPAVLLVVLAFGLTLFFMRPAPPREIVMSTGAGDGSYHADAIRYRDLLARDGVTLRLWPSSGALQNLERLADPSLQVDVALVQGGLITSREAATGLALLGSTHRRQFPASADSELPLSPEAERFYHSGPPFLQRYLPYWAANLADRLFVLLLPAVAILFPVMRLLPGVYSWRVRSRIYRWYGRLKEMELELEERPDQERLEAMLRRLDQMDQAVSQIDPPLAFSENLYIFRQHIDLVRERALTRMQRTAQSAGPAEQAPQRTEAGAPQTR